MDDQNKMGDVIGDPKKGFAVSSNRLSKAQKIERILCDYLKIPTLSNKRILDIGCGSGHISQYFSASNDVDSIDVIDQRTIPSPSAFRFTLTKGCELPFANASFDIILSNHILAYVADQDLHMREAFRLLRPGGVAYFATPNRTFPLEPHYKVPFLHYLPKRAYNSAMKQMKLFETEVHLLSRRRLLKAIRQAGFTAVDYTMEIIRHPARFGAESPSLPFLPNWFAHLSPTSIVLGQK